ncbi:unnamed protein product [Dibothriocephalus latus]|uniref:Uncharacterized protein n=1 Tax=Dibothriocephalus latus TaxID=60516 RepID=A0A3P6V4Q0_DIBLA|nr:unnamed protein product [Dibothriocephalus latus]
MFALSAAFNQPFLATKFSSHVITIYILDDNSRQEDQQQSEPTSPSPPSFYDRREDWANVPRALGLCSPRKSPLCSPFAPAEPVSSTVPPSRNEQPVSLAQKLCLCEHLPLPPHTSETGVAQEDEEEEVVITPTELSDTLTMPACGVPLGDEFRCKLEELIRQEMVKLKRTKQAYVNDIEFKLCLPQLVFLLIPLSVGAESVFFSEAEILPIIIAVIIVAQGLDCQVYQYNRCQQHHFMKITLHIRFTRTKLMYQKLVPIDNLAV